MYSRSSEGFKSRSIVLSTSYDTLNMVKLVTPTQVSTAYCVPVKVTVGVIVPVAVVPYLRYSDLYQLD